MDRWAPWRGRLERAWVLLRDHWLLALCTAIGTSLALRLAWRLMPAATARARAAQLRRRNSERGRYRVLERSLRRGSVDDFVARYWQWRDRLADEISGLRPSEIRCVAQSCGFADAWARFEGERYGGVRARTGVAALRAPLRAFRTALLSETRTRRVAASFGQLNPRATRRRQ